MGEWWYTDDDGRKIGWLFPEDFEAMCENIWGRFKWVNAFAKYTGMHRATIDGYRNGTRAIPKHIAILITLTENNYMKTNRKPMDVRVLNLKADWLPAAADRVMKVPSFPMEQ